MKDFTVSCRRLGGLRSVLFAALGMGLLPAQAGDTLFTNSAFDADAAGWYWENWSAAGSTAEFDGTRNSPVSGGSATSGSLRLTSAFTAAEGYQQAVFTIPLPAPENFIGSIGAVTFDVKVDESSTQRLDGDYGWLEVILRQGGSWDWVGLPGTRLIESGWRRVTFQVPKDGVDSIRALTFKLGENALQGPVTLNIDNIAYTTHPEDVVISHLDNGVPGEPLEGWVWESWSVAGTATFDPADTRGRSTSGTIRLEHQFTELPNSYQQSVFTFALPAEVNAAQDFVTVNLDVRVDPASVKRASGDYGFFEVILRNGTGWDWISTQNNGSSGTRISDNDWHHLELTINPLASQVHHLTFKVGDNALLGPVILNVDNLSFTRATAAPPPPTLALTPARSGLSLVTTSTDIYGRHNIYTADPGGDPTKYSFIDSSEPVSYSFTISSFPDATAHPGFQGHIFLVPGTPGSETSPDWNQPTLIFMDIKAGTGGTGNATFRIKTDQAGGNSELYGGGEPHTVVNSATIVGTWTITGKGSVLTMTAPDGTVSDPIDIGAEAAAFFRDGGSALRVYFGAQANGDANRGQGIGVGSIQIKRGTEVLLADSFPGSELNEELWVINAAAGAVQLIPPAEAGYVARWTIPDAGYRLERAGSLRPTSWTVVDSTPVTVGQTRQVILPPTVFEGTEVYLRLNKPE